MENAIEKVRTLQWKLHEILTEMRSLEFDKKCTSPRYIELTKQESQVRLDLDAAWKNFNSIGN